MKSMRPPALTTKTTRITRAIVLGAAIAVAFIVLVVLGHYLVDHLSSRAIWRARLVFLLTLEATYAVLATTTALAVPVLGVLLFRARKRRLNRPVSARLLLLFLSMFLVLGLSEGVANLWGRGLRRTTAMPVGGLRTSSQDDDEPKLPAPPEQVQLPTRFDDDQEGVHEILVVGESSAGGVPYDWWLSMGTMLTWQLERWIPGGRFHHTVLAFSGDTLEKQHKKLARIRRKPDLMVIYAGHNEFTARFPWSRRTAYYVDGDAPGLWESIVRAVENHSALCGMIREEIDKCRVALPPPPWTKRSLVDVAVFTPQELSLLLDDFERRLEAMVAFAERVNALPILIAPPSNEFDYEPNRSCLPPETTRLEREAFSRRFLDAKARERSDPESSLNTYQALLEQYPGFAELHHRLARLLAAKGRWEEAYRHGVAARQFDGFPERCPPSFHEVYRRVAERHRCVFIDAQELFHKIGFHGLLDDHLFHDGVHPSLRGQIALAQAALQAIHDCKAFGWPAGVPPPTIDPRECAKHHGLTPWAWEKVCNFGIMFYDLTTGLRYDPSERVAKRGRFGTALEWIKAGGSPEETGLPNIGVPEPVPLVPEAVRVPESAGAALQGQR